MYIRCPAVIFLRNYQSFFPPDKYLKNVRELYISEKADFLSLVVLLYQLFSFP